MLRSSEMSLKRRQEIFAYLCTIEDEGIRPPQSDMETANAFGTDEQSVKEIAREGLLADWELPELTEAAV